MLFNPKGHKFLLRGIFLSGPFRSFPIHIDRLPGWLARRRTAKGRLGEMPHVS